MEPNDEIMESPPSEPTEKRWSRKWWLSIGGAVVLGIGGLVYAALHSAAERFGEKGAETLFAASEGASARDDNLPHRPIAGDWCMVATYDAGARMLIDCYDDAVSCTRQATYLGHFLSEVQCLVVPPSTPMWCTVKAWKELAVDPPTTWCYFNNYECKQQGELCFPTTKASLARPTSKDH